VPTVAWLVAYIAIVDGAGTSVYGVSWVGKLPRREMAGGGSL
jgi:hypothetical protein